MIKLTSEEESFLESLIDVESNGEDVGGHVNSRLYEELSHAEVYNDPVICGVYTETEPGYEKELSVYEGLARKGMLVVSGKPGSYEYEGLTSDGRSYFTMKENAKAEQRRAIWSDRRFQIGLSVLGIFASIIAAVVTNVLMNIN